MLPKSSKHFIQPTASKLGLSTELVDDVVSFFYSAIRKNLTEMTGDNIQVPNFCSFKAKPKELPKLIAKYQKHLDVLEPETFNQMKLQKSLQLRLDRAKALQQQMNEEKSRKDKFIQLKNEKQQTNSNME